MTVDTVIIIIIKNHHHFEVRGATLELLDITYDGEEDSVTGVLSGGLGQLVIIIIIIMRISGDAGTLRRLWR